MDSTFRKSTKSYAQGDCVEVAKTDEGIVVRDSKNRDKGTLTFTPDEWDAFVVGAKNGEFDL